MLIRIGWRTEQHGRYKRGAVFGMHFETSTWHYWSEDKAWCSNRKQRKTWTRGIQVTLACIACMVKLCQKYIIIIDKDPYLLLVVYIVFSPDYLVDLLFYMSITFVLHYSRPPMLVVFLLVYSAAHFYQAIQIHCGDDPCSFCLVFCIVDIHKAIIIMKHHSFMFAEELCQLPRNATSLWWFTTASQQFRLDPMVKRQAINYYHY